MHALGLLLSVLVGGVLGFFGGGGSILTVPLLVYVMGLAPKPAIASSLLIIGAASSVAAVQHARAGNVDARTALLFGGAGMLGAHLGGRAGALLDGSLLLLLFAAMMALTAIAMWRGRRVGSAPPRQRATARSLVHGFSVGLFTGLVGAGGGFLIVPALALWGGLPMPRAVGTSLLVIVLQSLAAFAGYASHVEVDYALVGMIAMATLAGSAAGARLARRIDPNALRRGFATLVGVMACFVLIREASAWAEIARASLPTSAPQLVFALVVLGIGIAAGRSTRRAPGEPLPERAFSEGAGI
jgi:uncharacterized membrane protein YfcA